jgi:hypothetical protein
MVFEEAAIAFGNAGDVYKAEMAKAYHYREVARDIPESKTRGRHDAFLVAANAFERCAETARNSEEMKSHYAIAARCYADANSDDSRKATVRTLKLANMFQEAALYCLEHNLHDSGVSIIKEHKEKVDSNTAERIKNAARHWYLESKKLE